MRDKFCEIFGKEGQPGNKLGIGYGAIVTGVPSLTDL
jgi:hypothetical protein